MGRAGDLRPARERADRAGQGGDRLILRDDALVQLFFDAEEFLRLFFLNGGDRDAGPAGNHVFDVFAAYDAGGGVIEMILLTQRAKVFALFAFFVGVEAGLFRTRGWRWPESMRWTMNLIRFWTSVISSGSEV